MKTKNYHDTMDAENKGVNLKKMIAYSDNSAYCDESCHLESDKSNVMVVGAIWCPEEKKAEINREIRHLKKQFNMDSMFEAKWSKVSPGKIDFYAALLSYFFEREDLYYRAIVIPDKSQLDHEKFHQTHAQWNCKMHAEMLKPIFLLSDVCDVYINMRDTLANDKAIYTKELCEEMVKPEKVGKFQPIKAKEVQIMQLADLLTGAIAYANKQCLGDAKSVAKIQLVKQIQGASKLCSENKISVSFV